MLSVRDSDPVVAALRASQLYWPAEADEPLIRSDEFARLREICHALEILWGRVHGSSNQVDVEAYSTVWQALRSGKLVAKTFETGTIVPPSAWPELLVQDDPETCGEAVYESCLWYSTIPHRSRLMDHQSWHGLLPFSGCLPVVELPSAERFLASKRLFAPAVVKHSDRPSLEAAFSSWVAGFAGCSPPPNSKIEEWAQQNGITRARVRELKQKLAPAEWSQPGRRRS